MLKQYTSFYNPDLYYVIEGDLLSVADALDIKKEYDVDVVCIGTPNINENDLFNRIRINASAHGCWTEKYSDVELHKLCSEIIEQSKKELMFCKSNNLIYLDNSYSNKYLQDYVDSFNNV